MDAAQALVSTLDVMCGITATVAILVTGFRILRRTANAI